MNGIDILPAYKYAGFLFTSRQDATKRTVPVAVLLPSSLHGRHGHQSVILCDGVSRLKHEVPTNVADTTMVIQNLRLQSSAHAAGLPLVERVCLAQLGKLLTSFLVAAKLALKYGDLLFVLLDGFDIEMERRPVRERHRLGNAQINADLAGTTRTVVGEIHLRHDRDNARIRRKPSSA